MVRSVISLGIIVAAVAAAVWYSDRAPAAAAASCESLASLSLPKTTIASAQLVAAGAFTTPAPGAAVKARAPRVQGSARVLPCTGSVKRAGDTDVKIEVWMPAEKWNGDFQPAASGFAGGTIGYGGMSQILRTGAATASTNRGHDGGGPWKLSDMNDVPYHLMVEQCEDDREGVLRQRSEVQRDERVRRRRQPRRAAWKFRAGPPISTPRAAQGIVYYCERTTASRTCGSTRPRTRARRATSRRPSTR